MIGRTNWLARLALVAALMSSAAAPLWAQEAVPVRFGQHPTFERAVFDWAAPVTHRVEQQGSAVSIVFDRAANERNISRRAVDGAEIHNGPLPRSEKAVFVTEKICV